MTGAISDIRDDARYTTKEAAQILGVSVWTVRRRVQAGHLRRRMHRATGRMCFLGRDLRAFLTNDI